MPWKDASLMSLRLEFVTLASCPGANVRELCRRYGVSPKAAYKWLARFREGGSAALADRSRRPGTSPARTPGPVEAEVLRLRDENPAWGGRKLRRRLADLGHADVPAASTITAMLRRRGRLADAPAPAPFVRFEADAPDRLWQMDFKGHFATAAGRCHPLTVLDDHSRFALGVEACGDERDATVRGRLAALFRRYGLPDRILCDDGSPWGVAAAPGRRYTALGVWLLRLGVGVGHGRPYHPQTQGKDERFHRTLKAEVLQGRTFDDLDACRRRFDPWRESYNHLRPHEALRLAVPASRYRPSGRPFPETPPEWEYGPTDAVRKVCGAGAISFKGRLHDLGKAFRGERVAVRPTVEDGVFGVHFGVHEIARIDLRV